MTTAPTAAPTPDSVTASPLRDRRRPGRALAGLLLVTCAPAALKGGWIWAHAAGVLPPVPMLVGHGTFGLAIAGAGLWLALLVGERHTGRWERVAGVLLLLGAAVVGRVLYAAHGPGLQLAVEAVASAALLCWLTVELCRHHGVTTPEQDTPPSAGVTMLIGAGIFLAALVTVLARSPLMALLENVAPGLLVTPDDPGLVTRADRIGDMGLYVFTSVAEELVMVAAVVLLGRAAGWRLETIIALSLTLRVVTHLQMGALAITMVILGSVGLALFLRYRRVLPMIYAHFLFDGMVLSLSAWGLL